MQITHTGCATPGVGVSNQFAHYVQFLPSHIALPTCWIEEERSALRGTSLETALEAKLKSLDRECSEFRSATSSIAWCQRTWWDTNTGTLSFEDWKLIDAMYRSRALDLPGTGHSMIPYIDNANHASGDNTTSLYETDLDGNAILILRNGKDLKRGDEVTITYGDGKGACEMLFSYGFIEEGATSARELFLDLDVLDDDPLKLAKKAVSNSAPGFRLFDNNGHVSWEGPFVWLLCINEEDGLEFQLLQKNDGERELKVFWRGAEMSDLSKIATLLREDPKWPLFELRATVVVRDRVKKQLVILDNSKTDIVPVDGPVKEHTAIHYATKLRVLEETLMLQAYDEWENKVHRIVNTASLACFRTPILYTLSDNHPDCKRTVPFRDRARVPRQRNTEWVYIDTRGRFLLSKVH